MTTIRCVNHKVFEENLAEFNSYAQFKSTGQKIHNAERLLGLIEKYYQMLAYLNDKKQHENLFQIKGNWYKIEIKGANEKGEYQEICILDSEIIVKPIVSDLLPLLNSTIFEKYVSLLSTIFNTNNIKPENKIALLNVRSSVIKENWNSLILSVPEEVSLAFLELEKNIYGRYLFDKNGIPKKFSEHLQIDDLLAAYKLAIRCEIRIHIYHRKLIHIVKSLFRNLENIISKSSNEKITTQLVQYILSLIALNNNLFHTNPRQLLDENFSEYSNYLPDEILQKLKEMLYFNPQHFELSDTSIVLDSPDFKSVSEQDILTIATFIIPNYLSKSKHVIIEGAVLYFDPVHNLFDDAIFNLLDQLDVNINGLPLSYFADSLDNLGACSSITIEFNEFIHPDFEIKDGIYKELDLSAEKAKRGGVYLPFKDIIIDKLFSAVERPDWPHPEIQKLNINSNLISNVFVSYLDKRNPSEPAIHQAIHLITNYQSYIDARERYLNSISKHYFEDSNLEIRELVENVEITSYASFHKFCCKLLELILRKVIEQGTGYSLFWTDNNKPNQESKSQVAIYNLLRFISEIKGIKLLRETIASDGSVDFAFSYTANRKSLCICVELKNAHNQNLVHGIQTQLPLYIDDIGRKEGIFLVLWFKNNEFNQPSKFSKIEELVEILNVEKPKSYNIRTIVIDCNKRLAPSNPRRSLN